MILNVKGMSCGHCKQRVENALKELGFKDVSVDLNAGTANIGDEGAETRKAEMIAALDDVGYDAE